MVKLLMMWDIKPGHETAYLDFYSQQFTAGMMRLGFEPAEVWYTYWGEGPQILSGFVIDNLEMLQGVLKDPGWGTLRGELDEHVQNFRLKILPHTGRFQL